MLLAALLVSLAFPDDVVTPTLTEASGIDQSYAVRDGKLWHKLGKQPWAPFGGTGAPPGVTRPVVAVWADEVSHFMVMTDDGLLHHHENGAWDSLWGLPSLPIGRSTFKLPMATSDVAPGDVAYSMRRDHALYYEDIRGQQFHWGDVGCTSVFAKHPDDDTRILFGDPWIPPDWSREVCGPERGTIHIASLAASGSVLMVISTTGEVWTRFDDYDHNGGTPLFHYSYDANAPAQTRFGTDPASAIQVRQLPSQPWRRHAPIGSGASGGRPTKRIAIVQTGVGNDARELRVVGANDAGEMGVFTKQIADSSWTFTPRAAAEPVRADEWIERIGTETTAPTTTRRARAWPMRGVLQGPRSLGHITARTDDFSFHCSPFSLTLTIDGVDVPLIAHAVDAWTVFTHENPVDDADAPKLLKVTLMEQAGSALPVRVRARLDELMQGELGDAFAFVAVANQHELVISPLAYPITAGRSRWQLVLRARDDERARRHVTLRPASKRARAIDDPCQALRAVLEERADIERRLALFSSLEVGLPAGLGVADAATIATTTRYTVELLRWLTALELHVPAVAAAPSIAYGRWLAASEADFLEVTGRLRAACNSR